MDNVKVHYNSSQPAQLNVLAYAQGTDIHLAPGQEQHLPHEAWHVVQQAQGRVRPTLQMKDGIPVNDDQGLEHEADAMGDAGARRNARRRCQSRPRCRATPDAPVNQDVREAIINGGYADKGDYKLQTTSRTFTETTQVWKVGRKVAAEVEKTESIINSTFTDAALEKEKQYLDANWAGRIDVSKSTGGSGDTKGKHIDMPGWVYEYQNKLAAQKARDYVAKSWEKGNNPNWDKDSFLAQRVLEAFLRAWHKKELPDA